MDGPHPVRGCAHGMCEECKRAWDCAGGKLGRSEEGEAGLAAAAGAGAGKKRRASLKDRARAKKISRKAEREAGSDDEHLGGDTAFTANLDDPRFKVRRALGD